MTDPRKVRKIDDERQKRGRTYKKRYSLNKVGKKRATVTIAVPPIVIEKKAEEAGLSAEDFIRDHEVEAHFNSFDGIFYSFVRKEEDEEGSNEEGSNE